MQTPNARCLQHVGSATRQTALLGGAFLRVCVHASRASRDRVFTLRLVCDAISITLLRFVM